MSNSLFSGIQKVAGMKTHLYTIGAVISLSAGVSASAQTATYLKCRAYQNESEWQNFSIPRPGGGNQIFFEGGYDVHVSFYQTAHEIRVSKNGALKSGSHFNGTVNSIVHHDVESGIVVQCSYSNIFGD